MAAAGTHKSLMEKSGLKDSWVVSGIWIANRIGKVKLRLLDNCIWTRVAGNHMHWACMTHRRNKKHTKTDHGQGNATVVGILFVLFMYCKVPLVHCLICYVYFFCFGAPVSSHFSLWCTNNGSFSVVECALVSFIYGYCAPVRSYFWCCLTCELSFIIYDGPVDLFFSSSAIYSPLSLSVSHILQFL